MNAAQAFVEAKRVADLPDAEMGTTRETLLALARHPKEFGADACVTPFWKQSGVAYSKVPELYGVNLDK